MAQVYKEWWKQNESKRMLQAQKLWDWYFNDRDKIFGYILESMQKVFPAATLGRMNIRVMNIVRRVVRKISLINSQGIERMLDGGKQSKRSPEGDKKEIQTKDDIRYQDSLNKSTIARKQREWRRMGIYFNCVMVQPVCVYDTINPTVPSFKPYMDFIIHTPAWTVVEVDPLNTMKPISYWYKIKYTIEGIEQDVSVFWSKNEHYMMTADGRKVAVQGFNELNTPQTNQEFVNPYGVLPVAIYRVDEGNDFWGEGLWDLVDGNEEVCIQMTNLFYTSIFQSHGERVAVNMGLSDPLKTGPDVTHAIDGAGKQGNQNSEMYFINANAPIQIIQGMIDWFVDGIQKLKGLTPQASQIDPKAVSGIAKMMDAAEMAEDRAEQMIVDMDFEYDLFHIYRIVWNYWNKENQISETAQFGMKYTEPKPSSTIAEKVQEREAGLRNGWLSLVDIILDDNPGLSREEAEEKLKEIIEQNRRIKDIYGINEMLTSSTEDVKSEGE